MTEKKELSRGEVAQRLGCSQFQVLVFERAGKLSVRREKPLGQHGRVWYAVDEVEKLAKEWRPKRKNKIKVDSKIVESNVRGKVAATAFRMLAENQKNQILSTDDLFRAIVIATEADPILIRQIFEEWHVGYEKKRAIEEQARLDAEEREKQRDYDKRVREETFRKWKIQLATIEKQAAIEAQTAIELKVRKRVGT